jgi:hypothetical protein
MGTGTFAEGILYWLNLVRPVRWQKYRTVTCFCALESEDDHRTWRRRARQGMIFALLIVTALRRRMEVSTYTYREFLQNVISPSAISVIERMDPVISELYAVDDMLDTPLPIEDHEFHADKFTTRLRRIVRTLPPHISPMPNEIFCAIEFMVHEIQGEPILLGQAIYRLESLGDEIKADPLLHSLVTGRAN